MLLGDIVDESGLRIWVDNLQPGPKLQGLVVVVIVVHSRSGEARADMAVLSGEGGARAQAGSCAVVVVACRNQKAVTARQTSARTDDLATAHVPLQGFEDALQLGAGTVDDETTVAVLPAPSHLLEHALGQAIFAPSGAAVSADEGGELAQGRRFEGQGVLLGKEAKCEGAQRGGRNLSGKNDGLWKVGVGRFGGVDGGAESWGGGG